MHISDFILSSKFQFVVIGTNNKERIQKIKMSFRKKKLTYIHRSTEVFNNACHRSQSSILQCYRDTKNITKGVNNVTDRVHNVNGARL